MINAADTAFIMAAAGLVLLMTPGLALFYAGMVRNKNVLGILMQSFFMIALISVEWVYLGYSMSFGPDVAGVVGTLVLGVFASTAVNPGGIDGLIAGNIAQLGKQAFGVVVVGGYTLVVSWVLLKIANSTMGLRMDEEAEVAGLDYSEHSETAYNA